MTDVELELTVNARRVRMQVNPRLLLVQLLRERLELTGAHVGCDTAQCGACTVMLDDRSVKSCNMLAVQAAGRSVTTIEGLGTVDGSLHPLQEAFKRHHALQCGFCTPAMIMSALELLRRQPDAGEREIREALEGNLCRCTGYRGIVEAVAEVLMRARESSAGSPSSPGAEQQQ